MADFYFRAVVERGEKSKIAAVCYQLVDKGRPVDRLRILLSEEFGEKEILKKMKSLGLFERGKKFTPIGPDVRGDLSLMAGRAAHFGLIELKDERLHEFVEEKGLSTKQQPLAGPQSQQGTGARSAWGEKAGKLVERLTREAELFLKNHASEGDSAPEESGNP